MQRLHNMRRMLSRNLVPLLFNLAHLLANPVTDSTAEVHLNPTEATTSLGFKPDATSQPLGSSLLVTGNSRFKTQGTLTTGSPAFTTLDNYPQTNRRQPGRDNHASQTTSEWSSIVKTQTDETNQSHGNVVNNGGTTHYPDGAGPNVQKDMVLIQGNNQTSFNKNTTLKNKSTEEGNRNFMSCHPSRLVCFVTLWVLGVTASVFFGLTICLWVRLSVRQRRRVSVEGRETTRGVNSESLWVANKSTVEQRAEFWYSRGDLGGEERRTEHRSGRREHRGEEKEEQLWTQPKVTLKDITEFWYLNGRPRPEDHTS